MNNGSGKHLLAESRRFTLHVLTGVLAVAGHYAIMGIILHFGSGAALATTIGFVAGAVTRFFLSYYQVFEPTSGATVTVGQFLVALAAQAVGNGALFSAFLETGLSTWPAQIATTVLLTFANFAIYRLWVLR